MFNDNQGETLATKVGRSIKSCPNTVFSRLAHRKDIHLLQIELDERNELRPNALNVFQLIAIGIGGTIGTGIFVLSGQAAALHAGPSVIISFLIGGFVAMLAAFSFSEMASIMPSPGSAYVYTYVAMGHYPAFLIGWLSMSLYQLAASVVVVRWSQYVVDFIHLISDYNVTTSIVQAPTAWVDGANTLQKTGQVMNLPAIAITVAITVLLIIGIRETAIVNLVLVVFKIIVLLIFIVAGAVYVDRRNYRDFIPANQGSFGKFGFTGMLEASTFVFFAYIGFESISTVTHETKRGRRLFPLATIISLAITILLYIGICTVMVGLAPYGTLNSNRPLTDALKGKPYGIWLSIVLNLGAIASLTTVAISVLVAQTRILYSMSHDRFIPAIFSKYQRTTNTPWVTTLACGFVCALMAGVLPVDIIGEISAISALITFFTVHVCVIIMRFMHKHVAEPGTFHVPFGRWLLPTIGAILCVLLMITTSKGTWIRLLIWMAFGHVFYFSYSFWRSNTQRREPTSSCVSIIELIPELQPKGIETPRIPPTPVKIDEDTIEYKL